MSPLDPQKEDKKKSALATYLRPLAVTALLVALLILGYMLMNVWNGMPAVSGGGSPMRKPTRKMMGGCGCDMPSSSFSFST